ncbi:unnamed protein product [Urochloa humidicola]
MMCPQFLRLHLQFARACNQRGKIHSKAKEIKKVPSDLQNIHRCYCDGFCTHWCSAPPGGFFFFFIYTIHQVVWALLMGPLPTACSWLIQVLTTLNVCGVIVHVELQPDVSVIME